MSTMQRGPLSLIMNEYSVPSNHDSRGDSRTEIIKNSHSMVRVAANIYFNSGLEEILFEQEKRGIVNVP